MRACIIAAVFISGIAVQIGHLNSPTYAQDRTHDLTAGVRQALGGDSALKEVQGFVAEGSFRRAASGRRIEGTLTLTLLKPDKLRRVEEFAMGGMVGGPTIERASTLNGAAAWEEIATRGMGAGMQALHGGGAGPRGSGAGMPEQMREAIHGADGMPAGVGPQANSEQANEVRVRRMTAQMQRWSAALLVEPPYPWVHAGVAESPDAQADILESKDETGRALRLFVDQRTRLPLALQYQDPKPGAASVGADGRPMLAVYSMQLGGYKKVAGVLLPHQIDLSVDGQPFEEWSIKRFRLNPAIKGDTWVRK